jgi:hypothetical protein
MSPKNKNEVFVVPAERMEHFRDMLDDYREMKDALEEIGDGDEANINDHHCLEKKREKEEKEDEKPEYMRRDESLKIYDGLERIGLKEEDREKLKRNICTYVIDGETCAFGVQSSNGKDFDVYLTNVVNKRSGIVPK